MDIEKRISSYVAKCERIVERKRKGNVSNFSAITILFPSLSTQYNSWFLQIVDVF
jgi:hypothetical protein